MRQSLPPLFDLVTPMPYVALQQLLDEANAWGVHAYEKGAYVADLTDDIIELVTEQVPAKGSPMSAVLLYRLDGAYSAVGEDDTAFSGGRSPRYAAFMIGAAPDAEELPAERRWVRGFWEALRPHAIGGGDGYINGTADQRRGPGAGQLRRGQVRAAGPDQGRFRPGQRLPRQRQYRPACRGPVAGGAE